VFLRPAAYVSLYAWVTSSVCVMFIAVRAEIRWRKSIGKVVLSLRLVDTEQSLGARDLVAHAMKRCSVKRKSII